MVIHLKRILLVEDSANDIELTHEALAAYNLANTVDVARDGEEALEYLFRQGRFASRANGNPAVVLLDLGLPKVSGLEVLKRIRSDEKTKNVPVVILTSSHEERDQIESYGLGVNAYVIKPVGFHDFIEAVKGLGFFWGILNTPPSPGLC